MINDFQTYLFSYRYSGKDWSFEIKAKSAEDAKARLAIISKAKYDGLLVLSIPIPDVLGQGLSSPIH